MAAAAKAHLLWSPGFALSFTSCLFAEIALVAFVACVPAANELALDAFYQVEYLLMSGAHSLAWWWAISMLASSCCVLQLILSAASIGCSGLNGVLGPVRPAFLSTALLLQVASWLVVFQRRAKFQPLVALGTLLTLTLSLLPEAIALLNRRAPVPAHSELTCTLKLAKVGCTACERKVVQVAEAHPSVLRCAVDIDAASARLLLKDGADVERAEEEVVKQLAAAGYHEGKVVDVVDGEVRRRPPRRASPVPRRVRHK